jgi:serine/threonine protein kinase/uncharacterized protein HemY
MDDTRWQRLGRLFEAARALSPDERSDFLQRECPEDEELRAQAESLLGHDLQAGDTMHRVLEEASSRHAELTDPDLSGQRVGAYLLVKELARGGMGEVYLADQQEPVRRQVALKLIKHGMDTREVVARFAAERQTLALMDHPCIAKVHDAGSTEQGRPFFVMEYVQGERITRHCDAARLTIRQRLELFIRVCEGVQHAHQKAVIHRDIKPSNVLVTVQDGRSFPKIIDFGIAKAVAQPHTQGTLFTRAGQIVGTPEYMSPEQARLGDALVDTRTDVYSLGVLLFELLTGKLPLGRGKLRQAGPDEMRRILLEEDTPRPSTRVSGLGPDAEATSQSRGSTPGHLARRLSGDLDWITLKAVEKDPARRYSSPAELAEDLRRHLNNEPVLAAPPTASYRAAKFLRRHRGAAVFSAVAVLVLVGFMISMAVQNRRILRERDRANLEAQAASSVSSFLTDLFAVSDPDEARGNTVTAREILDRGAAEIPTALAGQPGVQAHLLATMGTVYDNLGLYDDAAPLLSESLRLRRNLGPAGREVTAESLHLLGGLETERGRHEEAVVYLQEALEILDGLPDADPDTEVATTITLGHALFSLNQYEEAERLYRSGIAGFQEIDPDHQHLGAALTNLGQLLQVQGKLEEAAAIHRESLAARQAAFHEDHTSIGESSHNLASVLHDLGQLDEAEALYRVSLDITTRAQGEDHPDAADTLVGLGRLLREKDDLDGAEEVLRRTLAIDRSALGLEHADVAYDLKELAGLLVAQGRTQQAEETYRQSLEMYRATVPADSPFIAVVLRGLADILMNDGRAAQAEPLLEEATDLTRNALAADHWLTLVATADLGACLGLLQRFGEGEPLLVDSYQVLQTTQGEDHRRSIRVQGQLVAFYEAWGRPDQAAAYKRSTAALAAPGA